MKLEKLLNFEYTLFTNMIIKILIIETRYQSLQRLSETSSLLLEKPLSKKESSLKPQGEFFAVNLEEGEFSTGEFSAEEVSSEKVFRHSHMNVDGLLVL